MGRFEVLTGPVRRRRWSEEEKLRILAEIESSGLSASAVARRYDLYPQQIYRWRQEFRRETAGGAKANGFLSVEVVSEREPGERTPEPCRFGSMIEVVLLNGRIVRFGSDIDARVLRSLVQTLEEA